MLVGYHSPCVRSPFCESSPKHARPKAYYFLHLNVYWFMYYRWTRNSQDLPEITFGYRRVDDTGAVYASRSYLQNLSFRATSETEICVPRIAWREVRHGRLSVWWLRPRESTCIPQYYCPGPCARDSLTHSNSIVIHPLGQCAYEEQSSESKPRSGSWICSGGGPLPSILERAIWRENNMEQ